MQAHYLPLLVILSLLIAWMAGYVILEFALHESPASGRGRRQWLAAGAATAGTGVWGMHFTGVLALSLPVPVEYDVALTFLSWMLPVAAFAAAFNMASREAQGGAGYLVCALWMGMAITGMHYVGMSAVRMAAFIRYDPWLVGLSFLIASLLSGLALGGIRQVAKTWGHAGLAARMGLAWLLGAAIAGMHYAGMAAAHFVPDAAPASLSLPGRELPERHLPMIVVAAAIVMLLGAILASVYRRRFAEHQRIAQTDAMTRLKNRYFLQQNLPGLLAQAERRGHSVYLAYIDLDGFQFINAERGHQVGDAVLAVVAQRLESIVRGGDLVARVAGDEFIVVLMSGGREQADVLLEAIRQALHQPILLTAFHGEECVSLSASIGVASHCVGHSAEELVRDADTAMYRAKRQGRNTWVWFSPHMDDERAVFAETVRGLRSALERREFCLYYQPKLAAGTRELVGLEALLRWNCPVRGLRTPGQFIAIAEKTGLILPIGNWVMREACRQLASWSREGLDVPVSVNISMLQLKSRHATAQLLAPMAEHGIAPHRLMMEITESVAIDEPLGVLEILDILHRKGVAISIDDFGTGYSSLSYLQKFPACELKIDQSFVRVASRDTAALELIRAMVAMGHALGMSVVAEGVEDEATAKLMEETGCDVLQGYAFSPPIPADEVRAWFPAAASARLA